MNITRFAIVILALGCGAMALSPAASAAKSDPPKTHATTKKPAPAAKGKSAAETGKVERLLAATGYTFVKRKPNVWSLAFAGKTLGKSVVVLTETPRLLVMFTIVAPSAAADKTPQLMQILLRANSTFDYVKIGFDQDGDVFVRLDAPARGTDSRQLKTDLEQLMSASDELAGQIAKFVKR